VSESESFTKAFEETGASLQAFTARYGSPEQFSRRYGSTGPWSDVFSLALVLIEAVVGHSALEGVDARSLFIASATPHAAHPAHTRRGSGRCGGSRLGRRAGGDPKERYANAGLFWDALLAALALSGEAPISGTGQPERSLPAVESEQPQ